MDNLKMFKDKYKLFLPPVILIFICLLSLFLWNFSLKNKFSINDIKIKNIEKKLEEEKKLNDNLKRELKEWEEVIYKVEGFKKRLGSYDKNITKIIKEIEELSIRAGVIPHLYNFNYGEKGKGHFLSFNITFPFEADYPSVRNFLNLLELSPSFITLNSISLNTTGEVSEKVRLQFQLTTYFYVEEQ